MPDTSRSEPCAPASPVDTPQVTGENEQSSLDMLSDYECPDCGEMSEMFGITEDEATAIFGGDDNGFLVCPECGEELEYTAEAAAANLAWLTEKLAENEAKKAAPSGSSEAPRD